MSKYHTAICLAVFLLAVEGEGHIVILWKIQIPILLTNIFSSWAGSKGQIPSNCSFPGSLDPPRLPNHLELYETVDPKSGLLKLRCTKGRNLKHPDISQSDLVDSGVRGIWTLKCNETTGMVNNAISFTCFLLIRNYLPWTLLSCQSLLLELERNMGRCCLASFKDNRENSNRKKG